MLMAHVAFIADLLTAIHHHLQLIKPFIKEVGLEHKNEMVVNKCVLVRAQSQVVASYRS